MILGYVSNTEIVSFMQKIDPNFTAGDVNEIIVNGIYNYINERIDDAYGIDTARILMDGNATKEIYCPQIPILTVQKIATINEDGTESFFIVNGVQKNIWWDNTTGRIWISTAEDFINIERGLDIDGMYYFPDRPKSVAITGTFGNLPTDFTKLVQLCLILKQYQILNPSKYKTDIIAEQIGRYSYKLANPSNVAPANQRMGLDGWIDFLFKQLPRNSSFVMESI
jgi:hypothetical protein